MNQYSPGALTLADGSDRPYYRQIIDQVRELVLTGVWVPGLELPSVRALARDLGVSVITVQRAYQELEREGFLTTRPGRPSLVAEVPRERLDPGCARELDLLLRQVVCHAGQLGLSRSEVIRRLRAAFTTEVRSA